MYYTVGGTIYRLRANLDPSDYDQLLIEPKVGITSTASQSHHIQKLATA